MGCDIEIEHCDLEVEYKGLSKSPDLEDQLNLGAYLSCSKCSENKIPVLFLKIEGLFTLIDFYDLSQNPPYNENMTESLGPVVQCLVPTAENLQLDPNATINSVPANCGLILYNINQ